jgi:rod shape-determining protein MreD
VTDVRPALFLVAVYYWAVFRPEAFPPPAAFVSGLLLDLLYAGPLGLNALSLVVAQWFVKSQRRFLSGQSFLVLWMCFFLVAAGVFALQWAAVSLFDFHVLPVKSIVISAALTGLLFPLLAGVLGAFLKRKRE